MFDKLFSRFRSHANAPSVTTSAAEPPSAVLVAVGPLVEGIPAGYEEVLHEGSVVPAYPERGMPAPSVPPEQLLASQQKLINLLHQVSSFSRADFDEFVIPCIHNYAKFVHLLPASESQHHCGQGGLFKHGLEVAVNASLASESRVFAFDHWASERRDLVPRWRMCALLGGMIHDMGKPISDVGAIDTSGSLIWNPHASSLYDWLLANKITEYYIYWRPGARHKRHEVFNTAMINRIIAPRTVQWITKHGGREPLEALIVALSGTPAPTNPLYDLIKKADSKSVERDIKESRIRMAASGHGGSTGVAMRISRCMHDQIQTGAWHINRLGSPVWYTDQGVFVMQDGFDVVAQILRDKGDNSIPRDRQTLVESLADWGFVHTNVQPVGEPLLTWDVQIDALDRAKPAPFRSKMIWLSNTEILPRDLIPPEPLAVKFIGAADQKPGLQVPQNPVPSSSAAVPPAAVSSSPTSAPQAAADAGSASPSNGAQAASPAPETTAEPTPVEPQRSGPAKASAQAGKGKRTRKETAPEPESSWSADDLANAAAPIDDDDRHHWDAVEDLEHQGRVDLLQMDAPQAVQVEVRDRANEPDPRDEMILSARRDHNSRWPPTTPDQASTFFQAEGTEGQIILALCGRVRAGDLVEGEHLWDIADKIHFRFPEAFEGLGISDTEIREMLEVKGWTERDPSTPTRSTVALVVANGRKAVTLRITEHLSVAVQLLLPARTAGALVPPAGKSEPKRVLPMGPYIDADMAGAIKDRVTPNVEDSPLVRLCFNDFAMTQAEELDTEVEALTPAQIHDCLQIFTKQHRLTSGKWLAYHLVRGENPWGVKGESQTAFTFNPAYRLDLDQAERTRRGIYG